MELIFKKSWQSEKGFSDVKFLSSTRGREGFWTIEPFAFPQLVTPGWHPKQLVRPQARPALVWTRSRAHVSASVSG